MLTEFEEIKQIRTDFISNNVTSTELLNLCSVMYYVLDKHDLTMEVSKAAGRFKTELDKETAKYQ